jgi:hypothetical protein
MAEPTKELVLNIKFINEDNKIDFIVIYIKNNIYKYSEILNKFYYKDYEDNKNYIIPNIIYIELN